MKNEMLDQFHRPLRDLRISVTDQCNFRCHYCMPEEKFGSDYSFLNKQEMMSFDEIVEFVRCFVSLGVDKIRITGGEPLLRKDIHELIKQIHQVNGVREIALTTNGTFLSRQAHLIKEAGLNRVTVSLDSLDDQRFGGINGRGVPVQTVLDGIQAALQVGLTVKVNMVVQKGVNDQDILPMARYFKDQNITLRFIEYMDVGTTNGWRLEEVVPSRDVLDMIHAEMPLEPVANPLYGEVAKRYRYLDSGTEVGFISSVTQAFCSTCTRARLSADGKLYTCLFASDGHNLLEPYRSGISQEQFITLISSIWNKREDRYSELRSSHTIKRSKVEMSRIGG